MKKSILTDRLSPKKARKLEASLREGVERGLLRRVLALESSRRLATRTAELDLRPNQTESDQ